MSTGFESFRLVPDDVLFFRDGKPSTQGADHYLRSLFPPHPATLYGALRTRRLIDEGVSLTGLGRKAWDVLPQELRRELGEWGGFGTLELRGPWLVRSKNGTQEPLVPAPADLGVAFETRSPVPKPARERRGLLREAPAPRLRRVARFLLEENSAGGHSHGLGLLRPRVWEGGGWALWPENREPRPAAGWYLTPRGLESWRRGGVPEIKELIHASELWVVEGRTGVGLDDNDRKHKEHMLYTFGFIRLRQGVSLGFEVRGGRLAAGTTVRFGGEGRTARLEPGPAFPAAAPSPAGSRVRVSFATPALGASGGWPPGFAAGSVEGTLGGRPCRLLGGVVPGFHLVGGWDLARGRAKPLRRALPAGSVFSFEFRGDEPSAGEAGLDDRNLSDFDEERLALQGFGLVVAGEEPRGA